MDLRRKSGLKKTKTSEMQSNNMLIKGYSAQEFVDRLLCEGASTPCDKTNSNFEASFALPPFYDEKLYKRGQIFFYDYFYSMIANIFLGLLAVISVPSIRRILINTGMSGSEIKSYRRYLATLLHVKIWYDEDLKPGSRLWKSLKDIRRMHNSASHNGCKADLGRISQKDMALTQMGFICFAIVRGEYLGIRDPSEDNLRSFIHIWRVIGSLMGMEDRYNICRESVEETKEICNLLLEQVFYPEIKKKDKDFLELAYYFTKGMWMLLPLSQFKSSMCHLHHIVQKNPDLSNLYFELNAFQRWHYGFGIGLRNSLQIHWWSVILNRLLRMAFVLMETFPLIACYYYGWKNATVDIGI